MNREGRQYEQVRSADSLADSKSLSSWLAARRPVTEVARADAKHEKMQQLSRSPPEEQTSFEKQKRALRDVNGFASPPCLNKVLMVTGRLSLI
jgi:hypothetical protein